MIACDNAQGTVVSNPPEPKPVEDLQSSNGEIMHDLMLGGLVIIVFIIITFEIRLLETILLAG
jgi:hypothetical protein